MEMQLKLNARKASRKALWMALANCIQAAPRAHKKALREAKDHYASPAGTRRKVAKRLTPTGENLWQHHIVHIIDEATK
jgi:hypothetical protein